MALTLLRHTTPAIASGTCYGISDLDLAGSFEAELAKLLPGLPQARCVISSPLSRCRRLADRVAAHLGSDLHLSRDWREMDFGRWEGLAWTAIPRAEIDAWNADFHGFRDHGGESVAELATRVRRGLDQAPEGALIVTHSGCIKAALALGGDRDGWQADTPFGGMVRVQQ